ncbi:MAG: hypothetical protein H8D67_08295 [Deltaproteobacteria bacterium]|nr:hypothetical protein [Deltaproteobacteria bacterium]
MKRDTIESDMVENRSKQLWAAVLIGAIEDVKKLAVTKSHDSVSKEEAKAWFQSDSKEIGSFLWICEIFNLDHDCVRTSIAKNYNRAADFSDQFTYEE